MPLTSHELDLLTSVLRVQSVTFDDARMKAFVRGFCADRSITIREDEGNLYLTTGQGRFVPCFVAHLDTVHPILPDDRYHIVRDADGVWSARNRHGDVSAPAGIGGDDKVGIFIALQMLLETPAARVALFRDEECGRAGAKVLDPGFFEHACFALECDRRGNSDFVRSIDGIDLQGGEFAAAVAQILSRFDYAPCPGGKTDVREIAAQGIPIPVANMSCCYYNPHCTSERVNEADVSRTLDLVRALTRELGGRDWRFQRPSEASLAW